MVAQWFLAFAPDEVTNAKPNAQKNEVSPKCHCNSYFGVINIWYHFFA